MIKQWLEDISLETFCATYFGHMPLARAGAARSVAAAWGWQAADGLLHCSARRNVLAVSRGQTVPVALPRSHRDLLCLFGRGIGVVVRNAEEACTSLSALSHAVTSDLPGRARVMIFATPKGTHGFGWVPTKKAVPAPKQSHSGTAKASTRACAPGAADGCDEP